MAQGMANSARQAPRALIIGGSVGGLFAGALLARQGWDAVIFERARGDLSGRGAGIGVSQELVDLLREAGGRFDPSSGTVNRVYCWMRRDASLAFEHLRPTLASTWQSVYRPLRAAVDDKVYFQGRALARIEQDENSVTAIFADGSRESGDLLIGADGVASTVRAQFLPGVEARYANYVAWRAMIEERDASARTLEALHDRTLMCFPPDELSLSMTVPGADNDMRPGHRRIYTIWYRPADRAALSRLCTDASGTDHGLTIPPPAIRPEILAEVREAAGRNLPEPVAGVIGKSPQLLLQAITDLESPRLVFGRAALLGDAAFVARPHSAAGVSKAALDAKCLAQELAHELAKATDTAGSLAAALARYETARLDFGRKIVAHARLAGAHIESRGAHNLSIECDPPHIIRNYGAQHLVSDVDINAFLAPQNASQ
ncbi:MAG: FAD-dependent oxidoreductase [Alphaproteobacteria bacterium]|nr:FAD-dependent oxidoreductase [Alphaproteobacteria bacterium]